MLYDENFMLEQRKDSLYKVFQREIQRKIWILKILALSRGFCINAFCVQNILLYIHV